MTHKVQIKVVFPVAVAVYVVEKRMRVDYAEQVIQIQIETRIYGRILVGYHLTVGIYLRCVAVIILARAKFERSHRRIGYANSQIKSVEYSARGRIFNRGPHGIGICHRCAVQVILFVVRIINNFGRPCRFRTPLVHFETNAKAVVHGTHSLPVV